MKLSYLLGAAMAAAAITAPAAPAARSASVEAWIARAYPPDPAGAAERRYALALADLDGDGRREALVLLLGREWCGSGGCTLVVLAPAGATWRLASRTTVVSAPVEILRTRHRGFADLAVTAAGGGIRRAHRIVLAFDGRRYVRRPDLAPTGPGEMAIRRGDTGTELPAQ
jgi:putative lipoprotein